MPSSLHPQWDAKQWQSDIDEAVWFWELLLLAIELDAAFLWEKTSKWHYNRLAHLSMTERVQKLFYVISVLKSKTRSKLIAEKHQSDLLELHCRLWHCAPVVVGPGSPDRKRFIVHRSPVIPAGTHYTTHVAVNKFLTGALPLDEDVGFIVLGVSWSDIDVVNEHKEKTVDAPTHIPLHHQERIVAHVKNGKTEEALKILRDWVHHRATYETRKQPTHTWYNNVCLFLCFLLLINSVTGIQVERSFVMLVLRT